MDRIVKIIRAKPLSEKQHERKTPNPSAPEDKISERKTSASRRGAAITRAPRADHKTSGD